jgi:hypothetical protein
MKKIIYILLAIVLFISLGCTTTAKTASMTAQAGSTVNSQNESDLQKYTSQSFDLLDNYSANFVIQFGGASKWTYNLQTRKSSEYRETALHIEGISKKLNPGDVRMVTDGMISKMIGPGTDQECMQFPNNRGMDPSFITPESLISSERLAGILSYVGEETTSGKPSLHYSGNTASTGAWKNARFEIWIEKSSGALLHFEMLASGEDTYFGSGSGTLFARYLVDSFETPSIEPVKGCEISVPLPDSISDFVRLPGLASFISSTGVDEMSAFFQNRLTQENWTQVDPPAISPNAVVLSYKRNNEEVEVHIQALVEGGTKVKLLFSNI